MKQVFVLLILIIAFAGIHCNSERGFVPLFNGQNLSGWFSKEGDINSWQAKDGILSCVAKGGGWLTYNKEFEDFILRLDWRIPRDGNSGVGLRYPVVSHVSADGMEIQILDDDAEKHRNIKPAQHTGSIYYQVPAKQGVAKPAGEWNSYEIICQGPRVIVRLNGIEVVNTNMDEHTVGEGGLKPLSKRPRRGHIGVQSHETGVDYRNIRIKELKKTAPVLTASVASVELSPPKEIKYALGGYGARMSKPAEGIHDPIFAKALVLNDGHKKFALVTLDVLALPPNVKLAVVKRIDELGWTFDNIMFLPSHSHTSLDMTALNDRNKLNIPQIGIFQPQLLEFVVQKLVEVILSADHNLQPVKIGTGSMELAGLNRNRRGDEAVDRMLTVLRIDRLDGSPLATLVNWTAHPTIMDETDMLLSAGWPGFMQREVEQQFDGKLICMYANGAQGDQSVVATGKGNHYERAAQYGRSIAEKVVALYQTISPVENPEFDYNNTITWLPEREAHPLFKQTGGSEYGITDEAMQVILTMLCPEKTAMQALKIGNAMIVGAPGELTAELGLQLKAFLKQNGIHYPIIGGLANEWISYILSAGQYNEGGYEASVSFYGRKLGSTVVNGMKMVATPLFAVASSRM